MRTNDIFVKGVMGRANGERDSWNAINGVYNREVGVIAFKTSSLRLSERTRFKNALRINRGIRNW